MNARTKTRTHILRLGVMAAALAAGVVILILIAADSEPVSATQPPPPVYYTVTINRSGGGDCTKFYFDAPVVTDPSSSSVQRSIQAGSQVWIGAFVECPCAYRFDHWEINGEEVNDGGPYNLTMFYLSENTTATAVFEPREGALVVYVEDLTPGSPLPHPHNPISYATGHAFWKLSGSCLPPAVQCGLGTWGFYPAGLREDDDHGFTDQRTYDLSQGELVSALSTTVWLIEDPPAYDPLTYNCTDALIDVAASAGVTLWAYGSCEHFVGNCPGALGETLNQY